MGRFCRPPLTNFTWTIHTRATPALHTRPTGWRILSHPMGLPFGGVLSASGHACGDVSGKLGSTTGLVSAKLNLRWPVNRVVQPPGAVIRFERLTVAPCSLEPGTHGLQGKSTTHCTT